MGFIEFMSALAGLFSKYAPVPLLAVALTCTVLIALPDELAAQLAIGPWIQDNRATLAVAGLASWMYFLAAGVSRAWHGSVGLLTSLRQKRGRRSILRGLTPVERGYLKMYVDRQTASIRVNLEDGVAGGLCSKGVLYVHQLALNHSILEGMPVNIQPWALAEITAKPEFLKDAVTPQRDVYGAVQEPGVPGRL